MNGEEPDIQLSAGSATGQRVITRPRPQQPVQVVEKVGGALSHLPIFIHLEVVATILASLPPGDPVEAGGLLVGHQGVDSNGKYLLISGAIPATSAEGERLSLTFTHQAWDQMLADKERSHADRLVVGWYHTHPRLGVFLSANDLFIHQHFFAASMQIALVIDPSDFAWGIFHWEEHRLVAAASYYIYGEADGSYEALARLLGEYRENWDITLEGI